MAMKLLQKTLDALPAVATLQAAQALPPVAWEKESCVEANLVAPGFTCGRPANSLMYSSRDKRAYVMCGWCADHNLGRGMVRVQYLTN